MESIHGNQISGVRLEGVKEIKAKFTYSLLTRKLGRASRIKFTATVEIENSEKS